MNIKHLAGTLIVGALALSACTIVTPTRPGPTQSPIESPLESPIATEQTPSDSNTPEVTATEVITLGVDMAATAEITPTDELTPTAEVGDTTVETDTTGETEAEETPQAAPAQSSEAMETEVTSIVVRVRALNVRSGPSTGFPVVYRMSYRQTATVTGISADEAWYRIECRNSSEGDCWVSAGSRYVIARK
jgi:hypothetical protein